MSSETGGTHKMAAAVNGRGSDSRRHRAVVIGAGFGGLYVTHALSRAPVAVTVTDRTNHHLFQPLLSKVATATGTRLRAEIPLPLELPTGC